MKRLTKDYRSSSPWVFLEVDSGFDRPGLIGQTVDERAT
jgi:hypothetical protein